MYRVRYRGYVRPWSRGRRDQEGKMAWRYLSYPCRCERGVAEAWRLLREWGDCWRCRRNASLLISAVSVPQTEESTLEPESGAEGLSIWCREDECGMKQRAGYMFTCSTLWGTLHSRTVSASFVKHEWEKRIDPSLPYTKAAPPQHSPESSTISSPSDSYEWSEIRSSSESSDAWV